MAQGKKKRRARLAGETKTNAIKVTRQKRHAKYGHSYSKKASTCQASWPNVERQKGSTFEDEYKTYRKTHGRSGLNPKPESRGPENPLYLARNSVLSTRRVPIGELMERSIQYKGHTNA